MVGPPAARAGTGFGELAVDAGLAVWTPYILLVGLFFILIFRLLLYTRCGFYVTDPDLSSFSQFFHAIMVQLFRPFANFDFPGQADAKAVTQASLSQMRRIIYTQRYRYGGPPFSSTTVGSIHLFTSSLLEELAKSEDVDPHARFYLVLAAEEMKRCGDSFPFIHKVLHQLLSKARSDGTRLPPDLDDMFDDLEARLSGHTRLAIFPQKYPILFRIGISDQAGGETDDLIDATYRLQLGDGEPQTDGVGSMAKSQGKGKGRRESGGGE